MPALPDMKARMVGVGIALFLLVSACADETVPALSVTTAPPLEGLAAEFAVSAERAISGTAFEAGGPETIARLVLELCEGLGLGAIPATIGGLGIDAPSGDREILTEVLSTGVVQVCPDRAPVDLAGFYIDTVRGTAEAGGALEVFQEDDVIRAGPIVCDALESGAGVEQALLATVSSLFAVEADSVDQLVGLIGEDQGLVAGAVVASATALLCPGYASEVEVYMESL